MKGVEMGKKVLKLAAIGLTLPGLGVIATEASGAVKLPTFITIHSKGLTFRGKVKTTDPSCILGRKVVLHRTNGNLLGTYTTGPSGTWKITASGSAGITLGSFYATVKQKNVGTVLVCKAAKSKTIPYHP
jgi:hypothetical protein